MDNIRFYSEEHRNFFQEMMIRSKVNDPYHRAFFYIMGISPETRANINSLFNFEEDGIIPEGMSGNWQRSGTLKICRLAFNLWNGYVEDGQEQCFSPDNIFCCEYASYFIEAVKLRYPEYCME